MWIALTGILIAVLVSIIKAVQDIIKDSKLKSVAVPENNWFVQNVFPLLQITLALIAASIGIIGILKQRAESTAANRKSQLLEIASGGQKSRPEFYFYFRRKGVKQSWEKYSKEKNEIDTHNANQSNSYFAFFPASSRSILFPQIIQTQTFPEKQVGTIYVFIGEASNEIDVYSTGNARQLGFPPRIVFLSDLLGGPVIGMNDRDDAIAITLRTSADWGWGSVFSNLHRSSVDSNRPLLRITMQTSECPVHPPDFTEAKLIVTLSHESDLKLSVPLKVAGGMCDTEHSAYTYYIRPIGEINVIDVAFDGAVA